MSEHITHVAIFEDSYRLMKLSSSFFPAPFLYCLEKFYDSGIVCCGTRDNSRHAIPIIEKYKGWKVEDYHQESLQHLAGALGWISHRAADTLLNPLADHIDKTHQPMFNGQDLKRYYEIVVMKEVYKEGQRSTESIYESLSPATLAEDMSPNPASRYVNMDLFETLITHYYLREFLKLMSFINQPPPKDLDAYLDKLLAHGQYFQEQLNLYIDAFENPNSLKMQEFVHHLNFYHTEDPLIKLVRRLQDGQNATQGEFKKAVTDIDQQCKYAQTLKLNYDFWRFSGAYYNGETKLSTLYEQLRM